MARVAELLTDLAESNPDMPGVIGVGVGLPGPVEFKSGRPVSPPIMPGWDGFNVPAYLTALTAAPVWVDNDVNTMALGELRAGVARGCTDMIFVKIGTGIGAGLVSGGKLHRGAEGCAGDIGHIAVRDSHVVCRCGQLGCLEALAGGFALGRDGAEAAENGTSPFLQRLSKEGHIVDARAVISGAHHGDPVCRALVIASARTVGEALAGLVNFFNPSLVLVGGAIASAGDLYLAEIRQTVLARSLPLATRNLMILPSPVSDAAGLRGAAFMAIDTLLSAQGLLTHHEVATSRS